MEWGRETGDTDGCSTDRQVDKVWGWEKKCVRRRGWLQMKNEGDGVGRKGRRDRIHLWVLSLFLSDAHSLREGLGEKGMGEVRVWETGMVGNGTVIADRRRRWLLDRETN